MSKKKVSKALPRAVKAWAVVAHGVIQNVQLMRRDAIDRLSPWRHDPDTWPDSDAHLIEGIFPPATGKKKGGEEVSIIKRLARSVLRIDLSQIEADATYHRDRNRNIEAHAGDLERRLRNSITIEGHVDPSGGLVMTFRTTPYCLMNAELSPREFEQCVRETMGHVITSRKRTRNADGGIAP